MSESNPSLMPRAKRMLQPTKDDQRHTIATLRADLDTANTTAERETTLRLQGDRFLRFVLLATPVGCLLAFLGGYVVGVATHG